MSKIILDELDSEWFSHYSLTCKHVASPNLLNSVKIIFTVIANFELLRNDVHDPPIYIPTYNGNSDYTTSVGLA